MGGRPAPLAQVVTRGEGWWRRRLFDKRSRTEQNNG